MKVLSEIPVLADQEYIVDQWLSSLYPISNNLMTWVQSKMQPGNTVVLFSGQHRFEFDATYIEPNFLSNTKHLNQSKKIIFANQNNPITLNYALKKLKIKNLLVINTAHFIGYRHWEEIAVDIKELKKYTEQVIITLPIERFDFNRLKYSNEQIAKALNGDIIDSTVVICQ
jgi:hypothetical protein